MGCEAVSAGFRIHPTGQAWHFLFDRQSLIFYIKHILN
jgi:hypothetical protein